MLDDVTEIRYQRLTLGGKLLRWVGDGTRLEKAVERNIDLLVLHCTVSFASQDWRMGDLRMGPCHFGRLFGELRQSKGYQRMTDELYIHTCGNAIELEFAVDISLLDLDIGGSVDGSHNDGRKTGLLGITKRKD